MSIRGREYEVTDDKKDLIDDLTDELRQAIEDAGEPVTRSVPTLDSGSKNPYKNITDRCIEMMVEIAMS